METVIISQYQASFKMLADAIQKCPQRLWADDKYENAYWRIVYHALFYSDLYLAGSEGNFQRWEKHLSGYNRLGRSNDDGTNIEITAIYSKEELLAYLQDVSNKAVRSVKQEQMTRQSGFEWLPMSVFELHLYTIRHTQHHVGQLIERLHENGIKGIAWEGRG